MVDNAFKITIKDKIKMYLNAGTNVTKRTRNLKPRSRVIRQKNMMYIGNFINKCKSFETVIEKEEKVI